MFPSLQNAVSPMSYVSMPVAQNAVNSFQKTYNPQQGAVNPQPAPTSAPTGGETLGVSTTSTQPLYDPVAEQQAAVAAQKRAQANALKSSISGIINNIRSVYDSIYGDINNVGADKANAVNQRFNKENTALIDQFNSEFPQIGNAYSGRNTYDSSYRTDAEDGATKQFGNMQQDLTMSRDDDLAKVGQFVATQRAGVTADKSSLDSISAAIAQSEDPTELQTLQAQIQDRLNKVQSSRAGLQSTASYQDQANSLVSTADRMAGLQQTLTNILQGQAPKPLQRTIAMKFIQGSGLPADQQSALINDFNQKLVR